MRGGCAWESLGHCSRRHACDEPASIEYSIGSEGAKALVTGLAGTQRISMAPKPRTADEWCKFLVEAERHERVQELPELETNGSHSTAATSANTPAGFQILVVNGGLRPCVDCGRVTGNFCEYECLAAIRIPKERWAPA